MQCPKCGNPVNPGQKFCTKCGQPLSAVPQQSVKSSANVCSSCGAPLNPGQKFCTKCGTKVMAAPQQHVGNPQGAPGEKGFWDNVRHPVTYFREGSEGVDRLVRQNRENDLRERAADLGYDVTPAPQTAQPQQPSQPRPQQPVQSASRPQNQPSRSQQSASRPASQQPVREQQTAQTQAQPQQSQQPQSRRLTVDNTSVEGVNLVSGRAIWDIHKGEVGRLITEAEFANAEGLKGVIVQEGCTGMVFVDGQFITMMQAGVYTFPAKTEAERQLEQRQKELDADQKELDKQRRAMEKEQREKDQAYANTFAARGVFGEVAAFGRGVMNFLFGKKKDETHQQHQQRVERTQQRLRTVPAPKLCRVYIISNRIINLIIGSQETADGVIDFAPMTIPTRLVDVNIGVSMQLEITNMQEFVKNYLADRKSVSILDFQHILMPGVKTILTQSLRNLDYQQEGLPETMVNNLKSRLQIDCGGRLFGVRVNKVLDITDSSADFERFRSVERELYASEKELSFLQRTGEFRNRLEQEQNRQVIDREQSKEDLRRALQSMNNDAHRYNRLDQDEMEQFDTNLDSTQRIRRAHQALDEANAMEEVRRGNQTLETSRTKDELLNKDELEQFVLLLDSQKRIRNANLQKDEAVAMEEVRAALLDLKKCKLIKDDEFAAAEVMLLRGRLEREDDTAAIEAEILRRRMNREDDTAVLEEELRRRRMSRGDDTASLQNEIDMHDMERSENKDALQNEFEQRRIDRENITQIMRIQASQKESMAQQIADFELSDSKRDHDMANELLKAQHQGNLAAAQLDNKRLLDAYNDERNEFDWNRARIRRLQDKEDEFNRRNREAEYNDARDDRAFDVNQRQQNADFQNRVRNEDYEWEKAQREQQLRQNNAAFNQQQAQNAALFQHNLNEQQAQNDFNRQNTLLQEKIAARDRAMQQMKDAEFRELQEMNRLAEANMRSNENIHSMDVQQAMHHDTVEGNMSAEQLRERNRQNWSVEAQVASFNAETARANAEGAKEQADFYKQREAEAREEAKKREEEARQRQLEDREDARRREEADRAQSDKDKDRMERMFNTMGQNMMGMGQQQMFNQQMAMQQQMAAQQQQFAQQQGYQQQMNNMQQNFMQQRYDDQRARADEYRQDAYHQQGRMDHTQDVALGMTGNIASSVATNVGTQRNDVNVNQNYNQPQGYAPQYEQPQEPQYRQEIPQAQGRFCPSCGATVPDDEMFCGECGQKM